MAVTGSRSGLLGALKQSAGGVWVFDNALYRAVVDSSGHLVELETGGRSLIPAGAAMGAYRGDTIAPASILRSDSPISLWCGDGNIGVWWRFAGGEIEVEYAINQAERPMPQFRLPDGDGLSITAFRPGERIAATIPVGASNPGPKAEIGFRTDARSHVFPPTEHLEFSTPVSIDGTKEAEIVVAICEVDMQEVLLEEARSVHLDSKKETVVQWQIPWSTPGVFDGSVRVAVDGACVAWKDFAFVYDLGSWRPPLYRPDDFWEFWEEQLPDMRSRPLDPALTLLEDDSTQEYAVYEVEITGVDGRRISGRYGEPTADGRYPIILSTPHPGKDLRLTSEEMHVAVAGQMEDVAKYRKMVSDRHTSNFRFVFLDYLRWLDFADSRGKADWNRCMAPAGSRGGPMVIAAAALDSRIKLITMNVPTCNRWDWQVMFTAGWGPWLADRTPGQTIEEFLRELSYFDPSHFAERVTIPVASSWGMRDDLSPLSGQLSMWVNLSGPRYLELRPWDGHSGWTPDFDRLMTDLKDALMAGRPLNTITVPGGIFHD